MKKGLLFVVFGLLFVISSYAQLNLQWQELGPDNAGATTTALILDKRDATRQTLYAGVMGGGIWKTTTGGNWWSYLGCAGNYAVSCITQAADGTIYFGTGGIYNNIGSSFNAGHNGNGIYRIDANDQFVHLASTNGDSLFTYGVSINRIAINPINVNHIIAATSHGLLQSNDGGVNWSLIVPAGFTNSTAQASSIDVKWANNGSLILATIANNSILVRSTDGGTSWDKISSVTNLGFPTTQGRIEIAIAPSNPNVAYVNIATTAGYGYGVWKTMDAGNTWDTIARRNGFFDPFRDQGWYDNAIAVSPYDSSKIFIGGAHMYSYSPVTGMKRLHQFVDPYIDSTSYLDQFGYVLNDLNPDEVYIYSDRGIYKSTDADIHFSSPRFYAKHYGLSARDFYSVAASRSGLVIGSSGDGRGTYISNLQSHNFTKIYITGDGFCEYSHLDTNHIFTESYFAGLVESVNGGNTFYSAYDNNIDPQNYDQPSRCGGQPNQNAPFICPFLLFETKSAFNTTDSVTFTASTSYAAGDSINVISATANTVFKATTPANLNSGASIKVPDAVQSKLFLTTNCGIWMKPHALSGINYNWYKITNNTASIFYCYAVSKDGNTLYAGTSSGRVYRITGLNVANYTGWNIADSMITTSTTVNSRPIEGIAIGPNNDSIVICTIAGYNTNQPNVYKTIDAGHTWLPLQAGPVGVPAYTCVIDAHNSNNYLVGTEHGIWSSSNAGATWQADYGDMCDVPVYRLRQLPLLEDDCMVLYAATNSRGLWRSFTLTPAGCNTSVAIEETKSNPQSPFSLSPNPATNTVTITVDESMVGSTATITDVTGRKMMAVQLQTTNTKQETTNLASGIYLVTITGTGGRSATKKLVISK